MSEEDNENEESLDVDDEGLEGDEESEERNLTVKRGDKNVSDS